MRRTRIKDIAEVVGVSEAAASFALNGKPGVSEELRNRVLAAARDLGWRPNVAARSLAANRAGAVGLVVARATQGFGTESFFLQLISGVSRTIQAHSLTLVLQIVDTLDEEMATYDTWYFEHRVDGVLVVDPRMNDPRPQRLTKLGLPAVLIGGTGGSLLPAVTISDDLAMRTIIDHLQQEGYEHLAYVSGLQELAHTQSRVDTFASYCPQLGLQTTEPFLTDYSAESGSTSTNLILGLTPRPHAVVYDNEVLALAGLATIQAAGLRVPEDIGVVVWEDSPIWTAIRPHLTALHRDATNLGSDGAALLISAIEGAHVTTVAEPNPTLIIRQSSRRARAPQPGEATKPR